MLSHVRRKKKEVIVSSTMIEIAIVTVMMMRPLRRPFAVVRDQSRAWISYTRSLGAEEVIGSPEYRREDGG
jgi:hypothetical protein